MTSVLPLPDDQPGIELHLEEFEVQVLRSLAGQMIDLVGVEHDPNADPLAALVGIDPDAAPSDDPAVRRLLPDAFADDPEASGEFRRFTERDLRSAKVRHAEQVLADLGDGGVVRVVGEQVPPWLGFLNDARLVLGARLQITEENHDELVELPEEDPRAALVGLYGWLTYLQESLVQTLLGPPSSS